MATQKIEKDIQSISTKLKTIETELNSSFLERKEEIKSLIITLIANENIAFVGTPGTGKSNLVSAFSSLINGQFFQRQVDGFTQPDDILGHYSFKQLREKDVRKLKTKNYAPEADIVYIGEAFKMNNTMMNSMLLLLNEREVDVGEGTRQSTNNKMIIADSNEYPTDGELAAFWDRWVVRLHVEEIKQDSSFNTFWNGFGTGNIGQVDTSKSIPMKDIDKMRSYLWQVDSSKLLPIIKHIRLELMKEEINVSTRRWGKIKKLIHATTLYNGRTVSNRKDLHMLLHSLWSSKEQQGIIARIMSECMGGDSHAANKLYSQASKALKELQQANIPTGPAGIQYLAPKVEILQSIVKEAEKLDITEEDVADTVEAIKSISTAISQMVSSRLRM
jgi:MoxR-like ATPase